MFRRKSNDSHRAHDPTMQQAKVNELRALLGPLSGRSLQYCTDACLRRYLEARNWNIEKTRKMLEETLKWRSTYKPEEILWHEVATESETGKLYRADFRDKQGRTVLIMRPAMQVGLSSIFVDKFRLRSKLVCLSMEKAILGLPEGEEQMVWLIDFTGWSLRQSTPLKTARETANILQNHYPERLQIGFLYNAPKIFGTFWKALRYFLDPKTFQKVNFVYPKCKASAELMQQFFDIETLPAMFGGRSPSKYDHEAYTKLMTMDDVKAAQFWGFSDQLAKSGNDHLLAEIKKDVKCAPPAS